ncbi:TerC family protein [Longimicrobium sp.]|jgi:predicted tellurium resistance membrane protein TerC|uniref:TerC family protein n=1 Tax=Longimicrobium sp. TaxID=2029185 RepID=UPI002ED8FD0B
MEWLLSSEALVALATLALLEIVLGIDNLVFLTILAGKLPPEQQPRARKIGLGLALGMRVGLLLVISWIIGLTRPLFSVLGQEISGRDLILLLGGLFLLAKATTEIHHKLEGASAGTPTSVKATFGAVIAQIVAMDLIFSLDSVITAVGMAEDIRVMVIAVVIAMAVMLAFAEPLGRFVQAHPTVQMLALSFLLLIGMTLVAEAFEVHVSKGYIYFAMGFSVFVEVLNLKFSKKGKPVDLIDG